MHENLFNEIAQRQTNTTYESDKIAPKNCIGLRIPEFVYNIRKEPFNESHHMNNFFLCKNNNNSFVINCISLIVQPLYNNNNNKICLLFTSFKLHLNLDRTYNLLGLADASNQNEKQNQPPATIHVFIIKKFDLINQICFVYIHKFTRNISFLFHFSMRTQTQTKKIL